MLHMIGHAFCPAGFGMSVVGAMILFFLYRMVR
jgi:uncharacterized membrane protein YeaQ/YmgE (transglycosylase-associated protein family)